MELWNCEVHNLCNWTQQPWWERGRLSIQPPLLLNHNSEVQVQTLILLFLQECILRSSHPQLWS